MNRTLFLLAVVATMPAATAAAVGAGEPAGTGSGAAVPSAASPQPQGSLAPAYERRAAAPHLLAHGKKPFRSFGYMKQADDDPDGLARIQDQARQLRPPR